MVSIWGVFILIFASVQFYARAFAMRKFFSGSFPISNFFINNLSFR